jgi:hypothetical protein
MAPALSGCQTGSGTVVLQDARNANGSSQLTCLALFNIAAAWLTLDKLDNGEKDWAGLVFMDAPVR